MTELKRFEDRGTGRNFLYFKDGKYLFATEQGQLAYEWDAKHVYELFKEKFPESEGYKVTVTKWEGRGHTPDWAK